MGDFSVWHGLLGTPMLLLIIGSVVLYFGLRKSGQAAKAEESTKEQQAEPIPEAQADKIKWLAAGGYILTLSDAFSSQLLGFYQFYAFGYLVCLPTLVPFVIFYFINREHPQPVVTTHLRMAVRLYVIYAIWSVVNGVLLSGVGANLVYAFIGVGLSIVMLGVLVWLSVRCGQGIIAAFKLHLPNMTLQRDTPQAARP